jgi:hypothetical protein
VRIYKAEFCTPRLGPEVGTVALSMKRRRPSVRSLFLVVLVSGLITSGWYRGPVFFLPYLMFVLIAGILIAVLLRYLPLPRKLSLVLVAGITCLISYLFCAPPSTARLFAGQLGVPVPQDLRDFQRWDENWGRDPAFYMRFYTSAVTIERFVRSGRLTKVQPSRPAPIPAFLDSIPEWWKPEEIDAPRCWQSRLIDGQGFFVKLRFDPESGLTYLSFLTL